MKFSIRDSKHDLLYKTLRPLATGLIKKQIQKAAQDAIGTGFEYIDGQLAAVRDRYTEAKRSNKASRAYALTPLFQRNKEPAERNRLTSRASPTSATLSLRSSRSATAP